ncbi:AfsR/SARP family transcriptional regulator [Streptomyces chryseus]|uniref:AfsR/SARP family transcriptional regulator n=1 Tax=Streptomyces chryseus TaxID=68186 RepID=UPI00110F6BE0|nr:BTAD domain-containing putative transcriptional regulator [Streptomyces chryseus]GGX44134.1 SARP family transcriptional regulator [Streptomyces chryseus]
MRFEVLGPLNVTTDDGSPVAVPEPKVRALLACLLVHHGRPVAVDRLIDDLWGEDAAPGNPGNTRNTLQTKVSQLRRTLEKAEPGARALVEYGPAGYALRVADEAVDAARFGALTARARARDTAGGVGQRMKVALFADALSLWRGDVAYAEFRDAPFVRAEATRLEEQRLTVAEELAELRLELGEHSLLADELAGPVALHPLRERLRAVHIRALYRAGRPTEALDAYHDLKQRLADELGLDPGAELTALHQAVLEQAPALAAPKPIPSTTAASVDARPPRTNLPAPVTTLVGRDDVVARVCALAGDARLVTLTGPGGVGKTRLALEAAARLTDAFAEGVWLVELAGARSGEAASVVESVAAALGIRDDTPRDGITALGTTLDRLAEAMGHRRLLLVLDNCEHVVEPVADLAEQLLRRAPHLHIIATSQEPLAIAGETLDTVAPLAEADAVRLFAARAAAAAPGFVLDEGNTEAVALICRRLDGIPLALELAATRVRALGVHALADRLHDRFRLLNQARRDAPARQRTLRAVIDWSWELLTAPERSVLRRLAVFWGGFVLDAAEEVCAAEDVRTDDVLDVLTRLVDRSLVVPVEDVYDTYVARYRMLESVTAYCRERLEEADESLPVRLRHASHFADLLERAERGLYGGDQRRWLRRIDSEAANVRTALDTAVEQGDAALALRLVNAMSWYWFLRGRLGEACRTLDLALGCAGGPARARADAGARRAAFALLTGDDSLLGENFEAADPRARLLLEYARCGFEGMEVRDAPLDTMLAEFRSAGDRWGVAAVLNARATRASYQGDLPALRAGAEESAALFGELGDRWGQLRSSEHLGVLAEIAGSYEEAAHLHQEGVRSAQELELWTDVSYRLARLGRVALLTGDDARATDYHERAARLAAEQSHRPAEQFAETGLALGARRRGDLDTAEKHLRPWLEWNRRLGVDSGTALILAQLGYIAEQRGDAESALALHRDGLAAARRTEDPRAVALALEGLAGAHAAAGAAIRAAELLGTAAALRDSVDASLPPAERADVDRAAARAGAALGEAAFTEAMSRGRTLPPEAHG